MDQEVPIAEKALLTIREAADYYNLGLHKLRELTNDEHCPCSPSLKSDAFTARRC